MKPNVLLLLFLLAVSGTLLNAQEARKEVIPALLIVDIQEFYFPSVDSPGLVNAEEAAVAAKAVLDVFRSREASVIHVRHQSDKGFEFHPNVMPAEGEKVITKTEVNSFLGTDLLAYLQAKKVSRLVIIGMQTNMCLEAAVRAAHDYGFECIVIDEACAARDQKYRNRTVKAEDVHAETLATLRSGGYAKVFSLGEFAEDYPTILFR